MGVPNLDKVYIHDDNRPYEENVPTFFDDRGSIAAILDNMHKFGIKRSYMVRNNKAGQVRAYHGHRESDTLMMCVYGSVQALAVNIDNHYDYVQATLTHEQPSIFVVPAGWYNGFMSLTDDTRLLVYSTATLEEVGKDDVRLPWDGIEHIKWEVINR